MSHSNPPGNGCSLEDCYTNLFALTDICGIKWKTLTADPATVDPLEDPVLQTYSKCINSDILCVWRRVTRQVEQPGSNPEQLTSSKELWIFWYGTEPENLKQILLRAALKENDNGAWDKEGSGISYECRTLLFKALHNLIERCLLTKGFVRLGRWFVQPHEALNAPVDRGTHLSFCFNFFLHGESSVCASIEIKQHPAVWRLTNQHLTTAQESPGNFPVILVPYGLSGNLTGNSYKESDQSANKILREWLQFYPVEMMDKEGDAHKVPPLVEVLVAGVRMKYPSCYVLLCDMEETTPRGQQTALPPTVPRQSTILHNGPLTPPNSPLDGATLAGDNTLKMGGGHQDVGQPAEINSGLLGRTARVFSARVTEKVSHDNCTTAGIAKRSMETTSEEAAIGVWNFSDPTVKTTCNCSRHKSRNKTNVANQDKLKNPALGKVQKGDKPEKVERQQSRFTRGAAPFHRRLGASEDIVQCDSPMLSGTSAPVSSNFGGSVTGTNLPQLNSTEGVATAGESPSPADMSPLDEHQSQNQILDPSMPKLSPHPPADTAGERDTSAINNIKSHNEQQTQSASATGGSSEFIKPCESSTPKGIDGVLSPLESWGQQSEAKTASINSWIKSQQPQQDIQGIKRPALPMHDADQDELVITSLYDFNPVKSWCEFPVKKQRLDYRYSSDVGNDDSSNMNNSGFQNAISSPMYKHSSAPDPYAFPDDGMDDAITPAMVSTRRLRPSHDERQSPHGKMDDPSKDPSKGSNDAFSFREDKTTDLSSLTSPPRSPNTLFGAGFTRERDLMAKVSDLDHMFESDDDNDDTFVDPSGPICKVSDEPKITKLSSTMLIPEGTGIITSDELIKMYPTPPSNNSSDRSPGTSCHDIPVETTLIDRPVIKTEIFTEDLFKDLPPVYKLPEKADFKGSDKYSPVSLQTRLSPVVVPPDYRGSWQLQYPMGHIPDIMEKPPSSSHYVNIPSIENIPSLPSRMPSSAIESSPATFQNSVSQQRTPMSFELQSPASNASSYLNKTLNSVDNQGTNNQVPEVDSLIVNIYLMDSRLNLFRDHNFDSCNICVCNMNIKGSDVGIYVPESSTSNSDSQIRCVCGFSAIMNRKSAHNAGLFYEDEVEITGIKDDRYEQRKPKLLALDYQKDSDDTSLCDDVTQSVLELILGQFTVPYPSSSTLQHLTRLRMGNATRYVESSEIFDLLQIQDGNDTVYTALDQGRQAMDHCPINKPDDSLKNTCLHKWQFLEGARRIPLNSQDSVQVLKSLQPLLQDAIQNKRVTRLWDKLSGPLTWKEFHQLAGRGHQENSTPQPVPSILVGHDRDWLSVSPYSLKFWDKQFLEPYGKPRDIAYVVLAPDNEHIINAIIVFFKELSTMYELNHMGRHSPVSKKLRDGIMRVGKKLAESVKNDDQLDPWFKQIGNSPIANKLRLYAQVCRAFLAPHLAQLKVDQTVFEPLTNHRPGYKPTEIKPEGNQSDHSSFSMPAPSSTPASQMDDRDAMGDDPLGSHKDGSLLDLEQEENQKSPALMIYLVDPFTYSSDWSPDLDRLTKIGLLRCYQQLVKALPEHMQSNVSLQILPLATILESTEKGSNSNLLKSISFSIFSTCRWNLTHTVVGKNLTGFGPAAAAEVFLRKKEDKSLTTKLYSPPFVLAPIKDKQMILKESTREEKQERSMVLFCAYCLSEDQRWLLAVCTDENGELMETCTINVEIPNRNRRKKASARKIGLQKLWDFLLGVISITTMPCRLVIGRFGRIGHGEMKGWSGLLSKRNLGTAGKRVKEMCTQCSMACTGDHPGVVSACLVSLESHTSFSIMADAIKVEERMSSNCPLQTPRDTSTTHILVFPTSATAQANSNVQAPEKAENDFDTFGLDDFNMDENDDPNGMLSTIHNDLFDSEIGFLEVFQEMTSSPHNGGPIGNLSNPNSPTGESGRHHSSAMNGPSVGKNTQSKDPQDEPPNLNQQPLAMGYYLSTAQPGPLPKWFWSTCPENEYQCPTCLKAALHIHCSSNHDDYYQLKKQSSSHPLDSTLTPDVLRYVLENYNALSWLTFDAVQNNRQSCLPIHFVVLLQMYHALNAFV